VDTRPDPLPTAITDHYMNVTLAGDIMLVNKTAFFVTISRHTNLEPLRLFQIKEQELKLMQFSNSTASTKSVASI
jgi:hypothetical protein